MLVTGIAPAALVATVANGELVTLSKNMLTEPKAVKPSALTWIESPTPPCKAERLIILGITERLACAELGVVSESVATMAYGVVLSGTCGTVNEAEKAPMVFNPAATWATGVTIDPK